jgi:undecaprenol kinase
VASHSSLPAASFILSPIRARAGLLKNRAFVDRLGFALVGIVEAFRRERSFRAQVAFASGAAVFIVAVRPGLLWAAAVMLAIALVLALELINSAFEAMIDRIHPEVAPEIKLAKDIAAGAVLVAACGAVVVGLLLVFQLIS